MTNISNGSAMANTGIKFAKVLTTALLRVMNLFG